LTPEIDGEFGPENKDHVPIPFSTGLAKPTDEYDVLQTESDAVLNTAAPACRLTLKLTVLDEVAQPPLSTNHSN
jgi:hypothetical protein